MSDSKLYQITVIALTFACALAATSNAESHVYGPYPNYDGYEIVQGPSFTVPTTGEITVVDPFGGEHTVTSMGGAVYESTRPVILHANSYVEFESQEGVPFNPQSDTITLTEIWGWKLVAGAPDMQGFDQGDLPMTDGWFTGLSAAEYPVTLETCSFEELPTRLPGYDTFNIIAQEPGTVLYIQQETLPASEFIQTPTPMEFTFDYLGVIEPGHPDWEDPDDPEFTYLHSWQLNITQWDPIVAKVNDVDVHAPHIHPGVIIVKPPTGWFEDAEPIMIAGRYGWQANPGSEITAVGPVFGFRVYAKTPLMDTGLVCLTDDDAVVSTYVETQVPAAPPQCGDWGYAPGDVNRDCRVNLEDLAAVADDWLSCTDPDDEECPQQGVAGIGIAFNGDSTQTPAKVLFLYDDTNEGTIQPDDIILEYEGAAVNTGAELLDTIMMMPDVQPGQALSLVVERQGVHHAISPTASLNPFFSEAITSYARCVYMFSRETGENYCRCEADPNTDWCKQGVGLAPWSFTNRVGLVNAWCEDSAGTTHGTPRIRIGGIRIFAK